MTVASQKSISDLTGDIDYNGVLFSKGTPCVYNHNPPALGMGLPRLEFKQAPRGSAGGEVFKNRKESFWTAHIID